MTLNTASLLNQILAPVFVLRKNLTVKYFNEPARSLFTRVEENMSLEDFFPDKSLMRAISAVFEGSSEENVDVFVSSSIDHYLQASVTPFEQEKEPKYAVLILHDVTSLRLAEQMRADFVANVSHELKTPLSTLIGFIETLLGPAKDDAEALEKFLKIMRAQTNRMDNLVRDLLSLSKIEVDEHTLPTGQVDVISVIRRVIDTLELRAAERGISIHLRTDLKQAVVQGEPEQIYQLFQNLIQNAVKYTRSQTTVDVILEAEYGAQHQQLWYRTTVRDQGEGIPRIHLPRLTERFYRVDAARSRDLGGTGLGLAIVKHILNRHRGKLLIESEVGKGSDFIALLRENSATAPLEKSSWEKQH